MDPQTLIQAIRAVPFRPFRLVLKSGEVVPVSESPIIGTDGHTVGVTKLRPDGRLTDDSWWFMISDIDRMEYVGDREPAAA